MGYSPWDCKEWDVTEQLSTAQHRFLIGFSDGTVVKNLPTNARDTGAVGSIHGLGRSPGEGIGYLLQYSWTSHVAQLVKNLPAMRETNLSSIPGLGRSPGDRKG